MDGGFKVTSKWAVQEAADLCLGLGYLYVSAWIDRRLERRAKTVFEQWLKEKRELLNIQKPSAIPKVYILQTQFGTYFGTFSTRASAEKRRDELFAGDANAMSLIEIAELEVSP